VLARYARAYAAEIGVSEGRVRAWISYMVLAGLLQRSEASGEGYRFTVKGGVALELRLRDRARATKDIDLVLHDADADLARAFEPAVTTGGAGNQGFQFRRKGEPLYLENRTISVEVAVTYEGGAWTSIVVDVARAEPGEGDVELVPAIPLREATGISGPTELACLPLRMHIAQKLHGNDAARATGQAERTLQGSDRRAADGAPRHRLRGTPGSVRVRLSHSSHARVATDARSADALGRTLR